LFFVYHNLYRGWLLWDSYYLRVFHIHFRSILPSYFN
jgi:hypothetical protein